MSAEGAEYGAHIRFRGLGINIKMIRTYSYIGYFIIVGDDDIFLFDGNSNGQNMPFRT